MPSRPFDRGLPLLLFLTVLFAASFLIRWAFIDNTRVYQPFSGDAGYYAIIGHNLAQQGKFSQELAGPPFAEGPLRAIKSSFSHRDPGYPLFLAAMVAATGSFDQFYRATLLVQALMGAATVVLAYLIARTLLPTGWSVAAALLTMLSPHLISLNNYILTETLFTLLLQGGLLLFLVGARRRSVPLAGAAGLTLGLAMCVRSILQPLPLALAALAWWQLRGDKALARRAVAVFLGCSFVFLLSWQAWKAVEMRGAERGPGLLGYVLYAGSYPGNEYKGPPAPGIPHYGVGMVHRDDPAFNSVIAGGYGRILAAIAAKFRDHPLDMTAWYLLGKPAMIWQWDIFHAGDINVYETAYTWYDRSPLAGLSKKAMRLLHPAAILLMHVPLLLLLFGRKAIPPDARFPLTVIAVVWAYFLGVHSILDASPRYALPIRPEVYLLAVLGVALLVSLAAKRPLRPR